MMAWIEVHQSLFDHRKLIQAAETLCIPEVHLVGHLAALWAWALDNAPTGLLPNSDRIIARGARWESEPLAFRNALLDAGFIEPTGDGRLAIHDWDDYGGKLAAQRAANAERQRQFRERQKAQSVTSQSPKNDVTVTLPLRNGLEQTREEKSREEQRRPPLPPNDKPPPSLYAKTLNGALPTLETIFAGIDRQFNAVWLGKELAAAADVVGPLSREQLGHGLQLAIDQLKRQMSAGTVRNPRPFAHRLIVDYLTEQREGHHGT